MRDQPRDHSPPAHGQLIRLAREAKGWSPEVAAGHMPYKFSGSSWRNIEAGYRGANRIAVPGRPSTVAAMAHTVGITSDRLQEHNPEAAEILREMERQAAQQAAAMPPVLSSAPAHVRRLIEVALEDVDPADRPELLREMAADYEAVMRRKARQADQSQRSRHTG
jgi:hypothetical protein